MASNKERQQISDERILKVLPIYYSGKYESTYQFLRDYNIAGSVFRKYLKRHNLKSLRHTTRKHYFDEHYFDNIDSEEKAYWLGFIQCDGYITENIIELGLCYRDVSHLQKFADSIKYNGEISYKTVASKYKACRLTLSSVQLMKPFLDFGLEKMRSTTMELLLTHNDDYFINYVMGIFDANGSISFTNYHKHGLSCMLSSGSLKFVTKLKDELEMYYDINNSMSIFKDKRSEFRYSCGFHKNLWTVFFSDYIKSDICLNRKKEKVNAVLYRSMKDV